MSHTEVVHVEVRKAAGTRSSRKLRAAGRTPVVLYGHGEESVNLSISTEEIGALVRHGGHVLELQGAVSGNALVKAVQWDALGHEVLHLDLTRVSQGESVEATLPVELRGTAPGSKVGGIVELLLHELEIRCPVASLPEKIQVSVNGLELGATIHVSELTLPEGVKAVTDGHQAVVHCVAPKAEALETVGESSEPEVIGRKAAEGGDGNAE